MLSRRTAYALFASQLVLYVALAVYIFPFSHAEGDFWQNTQEAARTGHVASTFLPTFYPFLCSLAYKASGVGGIVAFQALIYVGLALLVLRAVQEMSGAQRGAAFLAGAIALDPDLLSSIPKLWDTEVTALLLMGILVSCLALQRQADALALAGTGLIWGLSLTVRPNLAFMALPIGYALWSAYGKQAGVRGVALAAIAFATLAAGNTLAHGAFYLPQNGPYNFFAGANPFTQSALTHAFNAEPSIPAAMAAHGYPAVNSYALALRPVYTRFAVAFIAAHPFGWMWLAVVKLGTLLRPDTKAHALGTAAGLIKLLTSLSTPLWLAASFLARSWRSTDTLIILLAAAYILPFLLTNADPRFRPALDVLVLTHTAVLFLRSRAARRETAEFHSRFTPA